MIDFGVCNQKLEIQKDWNTLKTNAFGVTLNTYFSFTNLFMFFTSFAETMKIHASNMTVQTSAEQYKKFLKDIDRVKQLYPNYNESQKIQSLGI